MANSVASLEDFEFLEFEESDQELVGLSQWEFIDASDADSEEKHRHTDSEPREEPEDEDGIGPNGLIGPASFDSPIASPVPDSIGAHNRRRRRHTRLVRLLDLAFQTHLNYECLPGHDDDDDDEGDDGYGLDDELVPWSVGDKFGRERMRKLGKRTFAKMQNSKRSPHLVVRPGCVRGKHGLGLKHIY